MQRVNQKMDEFCEKKRDINYWKYTADQLKNKYTEKYHVTTFYLFLYFLKQG